MKNIADGLFGNPPNRSPGEVAIRLPGVVGTTQRATSPAQIRGRTNLNAVTMDNNIMAARGCRQFPMST